MTFLPTQPNQPNLREGGSLPPPGDASAPARAGAGGSAHRGGRWGAWADLCRRHVLVAAWLSIFSVGSYQAVSRYVVTAVVIQGRSMLPTLRDGEHYILNRLSYRYREPERHEVVVIRDPGHQDYAVKRIVAMPGDTLQLKDGAVFVNGQKQIEPYLAPGTTTACPLSSEIFVVLGKDQYFVLGDNRPLSEDSRTYGAIHRSQILGLIAP